MRAQLLLTVAAVSVGALVAPQLASAAPSSLNVGVALAGPGGAQLVTVSELAESSVIRNLAVTGPFRIAGGSCARGAILYVGRTCTIIVRPTAGVASQASGSVSVAKIDLRTGGTSSASFPLVGSTDSN